jgi:hypothetical protein
VCERKGTPAQSVLVVPPINTPLRGSFIFFVYSITEFRKIARRQFWQNIEFFSADFYIYADKSRLERLKTAFSSDFTV